MSAPQRPPVDELLHDEELAVRRLADFVDGDDVGVVEGRGGARLAQEALDRVRLARGAVPRISLSATGRLSRVSNAAKHLAHAAAADASVDAVVPERGRSHPVRGMGPQRPRALYIQERLQPPQKSAST